jgi:hypothetical protein
MTDWDQRQLCPDGACVGLIGADGKCVACGKQGIAVLAPPVPDEPPEPAATADAANEPEVADPVSDTGADPQREARPPYDDWDNRKLCPDGACVGVLVDGKCTVCGRSAA